LIGLNVCDIDLHHLNLRALVEDKLEEPIGHLVLVEQLELVPNLPHSLDVARRQVQLGAFDFVPVLALAPKMTATRAACIVVGPKVVEICARAEHRCSIAHAYIGWFEIQFGFGEDKLLLNL